MKWQELCDNKYLQDLPFKIELNKWGQIVMSPAKPKHSIYQGIIQELLNSMLDTGFAFPECAIATSDNVKVADVVWASDERLNIIEDQDVASIAPDTELQSNVVDRGDKEGKGDKGDKGEKVLCTNATSYEICVEIKSASNTLEEMEFKKDLYLEAKAEEVWLCDQKGRMVFYNQQGKLEQSLLVPDFPTQIRRRNQPTD